MTKLYKKNELGFALVWIGAYCLLQSLANPLSEKIGVDSSANAAFNIVMTAALIIWIKRNGLFERYGLCAPAAPASKFLWYIPLIVLASENLWNGAAINMPPVDTACYVVNMLCVGFVEEILFRGFLFMAIAKDNVKTAIIISSVTFGIGHIINLINGSGAELMSTVIQIVFAIAVGFLFVTIFYRGGSLIPCIITHSVIDVVSAFANEEGMTDVKRIIISSSLIVFVVIYTLILTKTLPKKLNTSNTSESTANQ